MYYVVRKLLKLHRINHLILKNIFLLLPTPLAIL